jgi:hypothetical protein
VRERHTRERRVLFIGLAVSVALHLLLIALAGRWLEPGPRAVLTSPDIAVPEPEAAMRAVRLSDLEVADAAVEDPAPPPGVVTATVTRPPGPEPEPDAPDDVDERRVALRSAAERLAPRVIEPRIWRPMVLLPREPRLEDVEARLAEAMEMLSDSALADAARAARARDWTVEDADGGRWGISPGKLHLGSITLPLPIYFPMDMEQQARDAYWAELETQLDRAEFMENFDARVRAIRERRERERAERRPSDNGGGP